MRAQEMMQAFYSQLGEQGYKGEIVAIEHLPELSAEIETRWQRGEFTKDIQEYLPPFPYHGPETLPDAKSIIIVAAPQPQFQVRFHINGSTFPVTIPPTYLLYTDRQVSTLLDRLLTPEGYHFARAKLPQKLLAVRSGLAQYGKNNISYIPGMGSFYRLIVFYSDFPCVEDHWGEVQAMECCSTCSICSKSCPTGAIDPERFLLHAERCLTLKNESSGEFPAWIESTSHNSLIGCMHCQSVCPANKDVVRHVEKREEFSHEETTLLVQGVSKTELPATTRQKLEHLDIIESNYFDVLSRNLTVLLENQKPLPVVDYAT